MFLKFMPRLFRRKGTLLPNGEIKELNEMLRQLDAEAIEKGQPPPSSLVTTGDGPCSVFWETVNKYNLRRTGETPEQTVARIRQECYSVHGRK